VSDRQREKDDHTNSITVPGYVPLLGIGSSVVWKFVFYDDRSRPLDRPFLKSLCWYAVKSYLNLRTSATSATVP
jgi:hypothetical protein